MRLETLRAKLHSIVNEIEDEAALNMLIKDAAVYLTTKNSTANDSLTSDQWATIEKAQQQIKNGEYKTYAEIKQHFAQWVTK